MANYESLYEFINEHIRQNGIQAIDGAIMNDVLKRIVRAVGDGMRFEGVVSPLSTPPESEYPKFCLAFTPGRYTNFGIASNVAFLSGFAVLYDYDGSNSWSMVTWQQASNSPTVQFVVDAAIKNNEYNGNNILYVSSASKQNNTGSFIVKRTNTAGDDLGTVASYSGADVSGIKRYELQLTDTTNAVLNISVNWDFVPDNSTSDFGYTEPIPQSAFAKETSQQIQNVVSLEAIAIEYDTQGYFYGLIVSGNYDMYLIRTQIASLINTKTVYLTSAEAGFQNGLFIPKNSSCFYLLDFDSANNVLEYKTFEYHHTTNNIEYWKNYIRGRISV